jgi:hypothetical protein
MKFAKKPNFSMSNSIFGAKTDGSAKISNGQVVLNMNPVEARKEWEQSNPPGANFLKVNESGLNPNEKGPVLPNAEGSPVNGAWEEAALYRGYNIATRKKQDGDKPVFELRVGGSTQRSQGVTFQSREAAVAEARTIIDSWESSTPPNPPTGDNTRLDGTVKEGNVIKNSGTPEGYKTKLHGGGSGLHAEAAAHYKAQAVRAANGGFGNKPDKDKATKFAKLATGAAVIAEASARAKDNDIAYTHAITAHNHAAAAHKAVCDGECSDHPSRKKAAAHSQSAKALEGLKDTVAKKSDKKDTKK